MTDMKKPRYKEWTLVDWDGNLTLGYECWRKSFGHGHVSVGVGDFKLIVYSHGANSEDSLSGTRMRKYGEITVDTAMAIVDRNRGYYNPKDND